METFVTPGPAAWEFLKDERAVVDPRLHVRGVAGLRVPDASMFPRLTAINPCLTVMTVGERAAELVLADAA